MVASYDHEGKSCPDFDIVINPNSTIRSSLKPHPLNFVPPTPLPPAFRITLIPTTVPSATVALLPFLWLQSLFQGLPTDTSNKHNSLSFQPIRSVSRSSLDLALNFVPLYSQPRSCISSFASREPRSCLLLQYLSLFGSSACGDSPSWVLCFPWPQ